MANYYELIAPIDIKQTIQASQMVKGRLQYGHKVLIPGEQYKLPDDEHFLKSLHAANIKMPSTPQLKAILDEHGVKYEEKHCATCGSRSKPFLYYNIINIVYDEGGGEDG